ncbi:glycoprotein endopeptidase [Candidatus Phycorickettsia trachydisci]|uniref:Glycoprotein endopeptidase n=1 Tax=Candidatus Phycorickettsia trachydisci TaxID=2115978 RepID=A0A2P1P9P1_9RICK|nr:tRNA (adenosine(37)-N6)-threonylcarbamoyltransferase complex dimerization subunit type 1 TsaB [Candidatus Phycorickettsia trachydisci]AVP88004.1 glycoprotein endopeptidase [Candidatus Phycorickettsia trachydisci]
MNILAIDTSCARASCAISSNNKLLAFIEDPELQMQAEHLFSLIDQAFKQANLNYQDITHLAVTNGPGSFTGIRIGLSAAKGILFAAPHISPICVTNFQVAAYRARKQISRKAQNIIVLLEASSTLLYVQTFNMDLEPISETEVMNNIQAINYIKSFDKLTAISGSGISLVNVYDFPENIIILPRFGQINARSLIMTAGNLQDLSSQIQPLYIRPPSAKPSIFF